MRLLVIQNALILPPSHPEAASERGSRQAADFVSGHLAGAGFQVDRLEVGHDLAVLVEALRSRRPDAVFNLYERMVDEPHSEARVATILERSGVAFTGSPASALRAGRDKDRTKRLARRAGLDVPTGFVASELPLADDLERWPLFVKPALRDSSQGIDQGAVVQGPAELEARVDWVLNEYGAPVLVEEYIPGREFQLDVVEAPELTVLPATEVRFPAGGDAWPIVTHDAKWNAAGQGGAGCDPGPAEIGPDLQRRLASLGRAAFRAIGCRDYARMDVRLRDDGRPVLIEVNPNPCLGPDRGLARTLAASGCDFGEFVARLARGSTRRMHLSVAG